MRVVSGAARGLHLEMIAEKDIRPTTEKVKESVFNIIQFDIQGKVFLDLFGGSGQIGIEAASRGASEVIIVDNNKSSLDVIKRNMCKLKNRFNVRLVDSDAVEFLKYSPQKADIVFLDPPYNSGLLEVLPGYINHAVNQGGIIITESSTEKNHGLSFGRFTHKKNYRYGSIQINMYTDRSGNSEV